MARTSLKDELPPFPISINGPPFDFSHRKINPASPARFITGVLDPSQIVVPPAGVNTPPFDACATIISRVAEISVGHIPFCTTT